MPLVSRWGSKVTTVPAREPKANSPRPITLPSRPIAVDLEPTASSLGALAGAPIPVKDFSIIPQAPAPEPPAPEIVAPVSGPFDLIASEELSNSSYSLRLGQAGRVDLGNPGVFQFENQSTQDDLTLSTWIKMAGAPMDDPDYDFTVFDYRDDVQRGFGARISGGETFQFSTTQPKISFYMFSDVGPGDDEEGVIATAQGVENVPSQNEWSHVMFSFDSTASNPEDGIKIWLDGRELPLSFHHSGPFTGIYRSNTCQLSVGAQPLSPYANSSGTVNVDDIAIFDYELSNINASELYNNGWSVLPNLMPIAYYSCGDAEDGLGNTVTNLESNNPDYVGALIGDAAFVQDGAPNGYTK